MYAYSAMSTRIRTYIAYAILGLAAASAISSAVRYRHEQAAADTFFSSVLQTMSTEEVVVYRGKSFRIHGGLVEAEDGMRTSTTAARNALRLAYARTLASRAPLLSAAGSDPQLLEDSTHQLAEVMDELAGVQMTAQETSAIRSLYPIHFLLSLAELEKARRTFIASGTDTDGDLYHASLRRALAAGRQDSTYFRKTYELITAGKKAQFQGFGGSISVQSMLDTSRSIESEFERLGSQSQELDACLKGRIENCYPDSLILGRAFPLSAAKTPRVSTASRTLIDSVRTLYAETFTKRASPIFTNSTPIVLTQSVCLRELPHPHVVIVGNEEPLGIAPLWYVGDVIFSPTENTKAPMLQYLAKKYDMRFSRINPTMFYLCPDVGTDLTRAKAVRASAKFAERHPEIARTYRSALLSTGDVWYESDAYVYTREALIEVLTQANSPGELRELEEIVLLWSSGSAGLDLIVANIVRITQNNLDTYAEGAPHDLSAQTLFLTHAAFPTLLLASDTSREMLYITPKARSTSNGTLPALVTYSDIRFDEHRDRIAHDLREFLVHEGAKF